MIILFQRNILKNSPSNRKLWSAVRIFEIRSAQIYHSVKRLTTSANVSQKEKPQHKKVDCPYPDDSIENFRFIILAMELHYVHAHPKYAKHTNVAIRDAIVASPQIPTLHRALFLSLMPFAVTIPNGIKLPTKHINNIITGKSLSGGCLSVNITYIIIQNHKTIMLTGSSMTRATENSTPLKDSHL